MRGTFPSKPVKRPPVFAKLPALEMVSDPSPLTWASVLHVVYAHHPSPVTNRQISDELKVDSQEVLMLTRIMYEAGALSRTLAPPRRSTLTLYYGIPE